MRIAHSKFIHIEFFFQKIIEFNFKDIKIKNNDVSLMSDKNEYHFIWYEGNDKENIFGMKILDIRSFTQNMVTTTKDSKIAENFAILAKSNGEQYKDKLPENHTTINCNLKYSCRGIDTGSIFIAPEMETKWHIFYHDDFFFFVRSWTGELVHRAHISFESNSLIILSIDSTTNELRFTDSELIIREVDFLLKSHLFRILTPHPVSNEMIKEDPLRIAISSFSLYGKKACYASAEDTTIFTFKKYIDIVRRTQNKKEFQ